MLLKYALFETIVHKLLKRVFDALVLAILPIINRYGLPTAWFSAKSEEQFFTSIEPNVTDYNLQVGKLIERNTLRK